MTPAPHRSTFGFRRPHARGLVLLRRFGSMVLRSVTRDSVRWSRNRETLLLSFLDQPHMTLHDASQRSGLEPRRVRAALSGLRGAYADEVSLLTLGCVRKPRSWLGVEYVLTDRGEREARAIQAARSEGRRL